MNSKTNAFERKRCGSALVTVMIVILLVSVAGAAMVGFAKQQAFSVTRVRDYMKAQAYAEAGANEAYSILKADFANAQDASMFPARTFGDGGYDAAVTPVGTDQASIESVGQCGNATITVKCDVMDMAPGGGGGGGGPPPPVGAYTYAIVSGDKMTWSGSGTIDVGAGMMHAEGQLKSSGSKRIKGALIESRYRIWTTGSVVLDGDAMTPIWKGKSPGNVTGTATTAMPDPVVLPTIDLTPYYDWAVANGEYYSGNQHFSGSSDIVINGGVMWVDGNFKRSGSGDIIGCIIATGDINISGSGDQIKVGDFPALIARDGDIDVSGSGKFHGLIYAMNGEFDKSGSGDTVGSIFCKSIFKGSGSWCAMSYENSTPVPPGGGGGGGGSSAHVVITAWQQ